ncbi:MAG: hypothetical protein U0973_11565 [Xanthomonadaceae bacterium]|nr:hypothetical protein [Xanthomonadaceae bacterium]
MQPLTPNRIKAYASGAVVVILIVGLMPWWLTVGLLLAVGIAGFAWWRKQRANTEE